MQIPISQIYFHKLQAADVKLLITLQQQYLRHRE